MGGEGGGVLLWERVQQNAPMVPMRTMTATKAPTAMPMITANGRDSAERKYPSGINRDKYSQLNKKIKKYYNNLLTNNLLISIKH